MTEERSLQDWLRIRAEANVKLGLAQKRRIYRFHQDDDSVKCDCDFSTDCSQCHGTGIVDAYYVVEEVFVEKPHYGCFIASEDIRFLVCHKEPIQQHDIFYWRHLGTSGSKAYYVVAVETPVPELGVTNVLCRAVPPWSPLNKFPLKETEA